MNLPVFDIFTPVKETGRLWTKKKLKTLAAELAKGLKKSDLNHFLVKKNQTRITQMDSQILSLYAKGMTTCEIVATFKAFRI